MGEWLTPTWYSTLGSSCDRMCFWLRLIRSISTVVSSNSCRSAWYLLSSMNKYSLRPSCSTLNGRSKTSHLLRRMTPTIINRVYSRCRIVLPVIVSQCRSKHSKVLPDKESRSRESAIACLCVSLFPFFSLFLFLSGGNVCCVRCFTPRWGMQ